MIKYFEGKGFRTFGFSYKENLGQVSLSKLAKDFDFFVRENVKGKFFLVGLSQGGIIGSYWLEFLGGKKRCNRIVSVCSPWYGSLLAFLFWNSGSKELRFRSDFLIKLRRQIKKSKLKYFSVWNPFDLMVIPGKSADLEFAKKNQRVFSIAHPRTFWKEKTMKFIEECLK